MITFASQSVLQVGKTLLKTGLHENYLFINQNFFCMKKLVFFFVCFLAPFCAFSQFSDDFSDGDFSKNPAWSGDVDWFTVNADHELQLNATRDASVAYLSLPSTLSSNASWEFRIKMNQKPSGNNYARIYLCSDRANLALTEELSGIYIRVGSSDTNVSLHSHANNRSKTLIAGTAKRLDSNPIDVCVKAVLKKDGTFLLYSKLDSENEFYKEGECILNELPTGQYFGIACYYTVSRLTHQSVDYFIVKSLDNNDPGHTGTISNEMDANQMQVTYDPASQQYQIHYKLERGGHRCRVLVFDMVGRQMRTLCNNETLRIEGEIPWDGKSDSGASLSHGVYIVFMEVYSDQGFLKRFKVPIVVR